MNKEIKEAIDSKGYLIKDEETNNSRYSVISSLLADEKCTPTALLRGLINGNGKVEMGSDADKAMHPFVELAKMYLCYDIEKLRTIQFMMWLREQGWLQQPNMSNEQMIDQYKTLTTN